MLLSDAVNSLGAMVYPCRTLLLMFMLDIVLSSQKEFVDNVKICEHLGCSDHNQIQFIIKVKGERKRKIRYRK